jgi:peptide deformylase
VSCGTAPASALPGLPDGLGFLPISSRVRPAGVPGGLFRLDLMSESATTTDIAPEGQVAEPGGEGDGLTAEERERREAALGQVRTFGDPVLKSRAAEIREFGPELEREAERMVELMRDAIGVGLAATQLGVMHRLLVFQSAPDATPTALANPVVEWLSDELAMATEGCLSLPGVAVDVERPLHARVSGQDVRGEALSIEASGLEARVLQHEIDHLDGVLMLDRTSRDQRKGALKALREGTTFAPEADDDDEPVAAE